MIFFSWAKKQILKRWRGHKQPEPTENLPEFLAPAMENLPDLPQPSDGKAERDMMAERARKPVLGRMKTQGFKYAPRLSDVKSTIFDESDDVLNGLTVAKIPKQNLTVSNPEDSSKSETVQPDKPQITDYTTKDFEIGLRKWDTLSSQSRKLASEKWGRDNGDSESSSSLTSMSDISTTDDEVSQSRGPGSKPGLLTILPRAKLGKSRPRLPEGVLSLDPRHAKTRMSASESSSEPSQVPIPFEAPALTYDNTKGLNRRRLVDNGMAGAASAFVFIGAVVGYFVFRRFSTKSSRPTVEERDLESGC